LEHALQRSREVLLQPNFEPTEFGKLKAQTIAGLRQALANPATVSDRELNKLLFGNSPLGRDSTPESIAAITLEDVKAFYGSIYRPDQAFLVCSGDITLERAKALAGKLLADWKPAQSPGPDYALPAAAEKRRIVLVDNPEGKQSVIR